ncbi:O-methyltransferase family 3 protein [Agrocybe pediades]|nr:O-methyltransferase family 3 protein [Agrocybe pediades]
MHTTHVPTPEGVNPDYHVNEEWKRSDEYHNSFLIPQDDSMAAVMKNCEAQGLPDIAVSAAQGKLLNLIAKSIGAKKVLEVGTLGGYSTIWFARALPTDGKVVTLEIDPHHAKVSQENFKIAGVEDKVEVVVGPATESLPKMRPDIPFDLAFIDADKEGNLFYFNEAKRLLRSGGIIIVDNVVRYGRVSDPNYKDSTIEGVRELLGALKDDKDVDATTIATVGVRGLDGFIYAVRK